MYNCTSVYLCTTVQGLRTINKNNKGRNSVLARTDKFRAWAAPLQLNIEHIGIQVITKALFLKVIPKNESYPFTQHSKRMKQKDSNPLSFCSLEHKCCIADENMLTLNHFTTSTFQHLFRSGSLKWLPTFLI